MLSDPLRAIDDVRRHDEVIRRILEQVGMPGRICHMTHERKTVGGAPSFIL